jgi:predicted metal-dependent phosphoesterase TrpH
MEYKKEATQTESDIDLHIHTIHCDGAQPEEVVTEADKYNLRAIAITDHQETTGIDAVKEEAEKQGSSLEVISSVELSTLEGFDILGYLIEYENNEPLRETLDRIQKGRKVRERRAIEAMQEFFDRFKVGLTIDFESVLELTINGNIAGGHIEKHVYEQINDLYKNDPDKYGYVMTALIDGINDTSTDARLVFDHSWKIDHSTGVKIVKEDLIRQYLLKRGRPCHIKRTPDDCLSAEEAIDTILRAKGVPTIAHPGGTDKDIVMTAIIDMGIEGLEVYSSKHRPDQNAHYVGIATQRGLVQTGGSDWHGKEFTPHLTPGKVGSLSMQGTNAIIVLSYNLMVKQLRKRKEQMRADGKFNF